MATNETVKQINSGGTLRDVEDVGARQLIATLQTALNAITSGDTTTAIKTFNEIIAFLDNIEDSSTLQGIIAGLNTSIAAKYTKPGTGIPASDLAQAVQAILDSVENKANSADVYPKSQTYSKDEVDAKVADAGKVKSVTINGTKKTPNETTGDVDLGTIVGQQGPQGEQGPAGPQGNSGVASADGIESVNNLNGGTTDTESKVYVLGANMGKTLGDAVFGQSEINGVFQDCIYAGLVSDGDSVGNTFDDTVRTQYGDDVSFNYCSLKVSAGDKIHIKIKPNGYNCGAPSTHNDKVVLSRISKDKVLTDSDFDIETDGYVFVANAKAQLANPELKKYPTVGHEQRIEAIEELMSSMTVLDGAVIPIPLTFGFNPYPNTVKYFFNFNNASTTAACSGWLNLPKGTYNLVSTLAFKVYQTDTPLVDCDYAKLNENIWESTGQSGTSTLTIEHGYTMFKVESGVTSNSDLSQIFTLTLVSKTAEPATPASYNKPHVASFLYASANDPSCYRIYLPLREKCLVVNLKYFDTTFGGFMPHYGIEYFYLPNDAPIPYAATQITRSSEAECAINLTAGSHTNTYIGGHMHGYEQTVLADTAVYINGEEKTITDSWSADVVKLFELQTHSQLFDTDKTTVLADVYKRWRVIDGKLQLHLYSRVVFRTSAHINRAQFSMFGILRKLGNDYLTCWATRNDDTIVYKTTDGWDTNNHTDGWDAISQPAKASLQEQWGELGYLVKQEIFENNQKENGGMFINTNGGGEYNKMYFELGSDFDVASGDVLFCHSALSIE